MNLLVIDAGNTRVKWGYADAGGWVRHGWLATADAARLDAALRELPAPARIVAANVAGEAVRDALARALAPCGVAPEWVVARDAQCGVKSGYADPAQLGADRWAGLIAAWKLFGCAGRACVVVNAGTTMTVDALSMEGVFLGGVIVPGIELMRGALDAGTAQLRLRPGAFHFFPDNTADAIMSGAINALAGAVERIRGYMEETGQGAPLVVLSGGAAQLIQPRLNGKVELVDNLVLEGLLEIAKQQ
jgi:type III pantothenate kinase